jgi:hypothetical protein
LEETNIAVVGTVFANFAEHIVGDLDIACLRRTSGDSLLEVAVLSGVSHFRVDLHGCELSCFEGGSDCKKGSMVATSLGKERKDEVAAVTPN